MCQGRNNYYSLKREANFALGELLYNQKKYEEAEAYLERVKYHSSRNMCKYAQVLERLGEWEKAKYCYLDAPSMDEPAIE